MGRYSLIAIDRKNNSERTIKFYDDEQGKVINKSSLSEIDFLTSSFSDEIAFNKYLRDCGDNTFDNERYCVLTTYDGKDYYFKVIFNSELINRVSKNVNAGYITVSDDYRSIINLFYSSIFDKNFQESISNTNYIKGKLKDKMLKYIQLSIKEKNHSDELTEQNQLKFEIDEELKRYKTFRGLYLFMEKYKKYGYVDKPSYIYNSNKNNSVQESSSSENNIVGNDKERVDLISSADDYNKEYDEFLSEDEYNDAYGEGNATQYVKGARHD